MNIENKTCFIQFRCTVSVKEAIRKSAKEVNLSMSEYLLRQNNKHIVHHIPLLKLLHSLSNNDMKVENNLNQIAKQMNSPNIMVTENKFDELLFCLIELGKKRDKTIYDLNEIRKILAR